MSLNDATVSAASLSAVVIQCGMVKRIDMAGNVRRPAQAKNRHDQLPRKTKLNKNAAPKKNRFSPARPAHHSIIALLLLHGLSPVVCGPNQADGFRGFKKIRFDLLPKPNQLLANSWQMCASQPQSAPIQPDGRIVVFAPFNIKWILFNQSYDFVTGWAERGRRTWNVTFP